MYFLLKNSIVAPRHGNNVFFILFSYLHQIHTFKNNLNDEEILISHLTLLVNYITKGCLFDDKKSLIKQKLG